MADEILGINTLIIGPSGTGKTTSLKTLLQVPDLEIFAMFTEPRYDVLGRDFLDKIHWRYIPPATGSWATLIDTAKKINVLGNDSLQKLPGIDKNKCTQFITMLEQMANFTDQHGKTFGAVETWGTNRVLIVDGLTGINKSARNLAVGLKPVLTQPDWGVSMQTILSFIDALTNSTRCHFILLAHVERETDEVSGGVKVMVSTLGKKLAPQLIPNFGDVILSVKQGKEFFWDTANIQADLKNGNLPISSKIEANFKLIFDAWKARGGQIASPTPAAVLA